MTIPGVNVTVAIGLLSAIGDITDSPTPARLSSYFGLTPSTYQSGDTCYHGRLTKQGRSHARWLAVEAARAIANSNVPLAAAYHRIRRKKGHNVAVSALARKLVVLLVAIERPEFEISDEELTCGVHVAALYEESQPCMRKSHRRRSPWGGWCPGSTTSLRSTPSVTLQPPANPFPD
jgi:hypothetical protein